MEKKQHEIKPFECPSCKYTGDKAQALGEEGEPAPGDWAVCLNCGHVNELTKSGDFKKVKPKALEKLKKKDLKTWLELFSACATIKSRGPLRHNN